MAVNRYQAIAEGSSRSVHQKGRVVLPQEWREKHSIQRGDIVAMMETDDGTLEIIPPDVE